MATALANLIPLLFKLIICLILMAGAVAAVAMLIAMFKIVIYICSKKKWED